VILENPDRYIGKTEHGASHAGSFGAVCALLQSYEHGSCRGGQLSHMDTALSYLCTPSPPLQCCSGRRALEHGPCCGQHQQGHRQDPQVRPLSAVIAPWCKYPAPCPFLAQDLRTSIRSIPVCVPAQAGKLSPEGCWELVTGAAFHSCRYADVSDEKAASGGYPGELPADAA
jgi:hypothetical protein